MHIGAMAYCISGVLVFLIHGGGSDGGNAERRELAVKSTRLDVNTVLKHCLL